MYMGIDLEALIRFLEQSQAVKLNRKFTFVDFDQFDRIVSKHLIDEPQKIIVKPVLQVWGRLNDGRNKLSGFLVATGLLKSNLVIVGYSAETVDEINIEYEKGKFMELIEASFIDVIVANKFSKEIITLDITVE